MVTEELLRYASMPAEQWLRDQLVAALRERLDLDFIDPAITAVARHQAGVDHQRRHDGDVGWLFGRCGAYAISRR